MQRLSGRILRKRGRILFKGRQRVELRQQLQCNLGVASQCWSGRLRQHAIFRKFSGIGRREKKFNGRVH